ncbi:MAG: LamG-like jellyroll fold domain-containing protein [Chthoniobacter sp.]
MSDERTQLLLQRYFDQVLTVEERHELSTMLLASARAREEFWELARWHALIRQWGEAEWGRRDAEEITLRPLPAVQAPPQSQPKPRRKIIRFPLPSWKAGAAALAAAAAVALFVSVPSLLPWNRKVQSVSVAVLTHSADAVWAESGAGKQRGESLTPGWLHLKSGAVQIEFSRGARVVLEGPADFQLLTDNSAYLETGKLRAQVPEPAHGFTVKTSSFAVVDYGTEFGCSLVASAAPQVHVFNGLVGVQNARSTERKLRQNQAVEIDRDKLHDIPARRDQFLSDEELARRERASVQGRLVAWHEASQALSEHSATLVHLDFEGDRGWSRNIPNRAWRAVPGSPASMVGCQFTDGRWPGKGAVEFTRPEDRIRFNLPGGYESMTLLAWVRVDTMPDRPQSLIMADGMGTGDVQWYISRWGELGFGVHIGKTGDPTGWRYHHSEPLFTAETAGSWACVASVYDSSTDTVTHYFNGQPVGADKLGVRALLQLETFEIGNWALRDGEQWRAGIVPRSAKDSARNLQGRIDEVAVVSAPLSAEEIRHYYEIGRNDQAAATTLVKNIAK